MGSHAELMADHWVEDHEKRRFGNPEAGALR